MRFGVVKKKNGKKKKKIENGRVGVRVCER